MRISKSGTRRGTLEPRRAKRTSSSKTANFPQIFEAEQNADLDLAEALTEIDEYARRFRESPIYEHLLRYKTKVRALLRYLVRQSYLVEENSFYDPLGRRRLMMVVENIDQRLETLTRDFLHNQAKNIDLVSRLDEIRGLLLDLYS